MLLATPWAAPVFQCNFKSNSFGQKGGITATLVSRDAFVLCAVTRRAPVQPPPTSMENMSLKSTYLNFECIHICISLHLFAHSASPRAVGLVEAGLHSVRPAASPVVVQHVDGKDPPSK